MTRKKNEFKTDEIRRRSIITGYAAMVLTCTVGAATCFAAGDPISTMKSHDPSARANGFLTLAGGIIITFTKEILNVII